MQFDLLSALMATPDPNYTPPPIQFGPRSTNAPKPRTAPHFYRCDLCLTTFTVTAKLPGHERNLNYGAAVCACGHDCMEYLGESKVDRLFETKMLCACDFRCTEARGPNCTCKCNGVNHGTGLMIEVTRDKGPIPILKMKSALLCKLHRQQWEQAQIEAMARLERKHGQNWRDKKAGLRIESRDAFLAIIDDTKRLNDARKLKSQTGRMKAIAKIGT